MLSSEWKSEQQWKEQLSRLTAPLDAKEKWTVASMILGAADSRRTVGQAMLATTWEWVGESQAWKAAQSEDHSVNGYDHFCQRFDPDRVLQKAVRAYRSSESKKKIALAAIVSWPPELHTIGEFNPGERMLQGLARLARKSQNNTDLIKLCLNAATLTRFQEGKGRTRGVMFTLSDIDAAAAMAGRIVEETISQPLISSKDARSVGLRFCKGLLYPSDVFDLE
jgi:hypothetical protein